MDSFSFPFFTSFFFTSDFFLGDSSSLPDFVELSLSFRFFFLPFALFFASDLVEDALESRESERFVFLAAVFFLFFFPSSSASDPDSDAFRTRFFDDV